jgi:hypothetical protein
MARRKKSRRRRSPSKIGLLNIAESYTYLAIMTTGLMGANPYEFLTGKSDISSKSVYGGEFGGVTSMVTTGTDTLSLSELFKHPDIAFGQVQSNFMGNWQNMVVASLVTSVGFGVGRKMLRKPIANVNRNIFKPLGIGVKL